MLQNREFRKPGVGTVTSSPRPTTTANVRVPAEEDIRRRAYELYEARGREPGHEAEDWARAERELREEARQ